MAAIFIRSSNAWRGSHGGGVRKWIIFLLYIYILLYFYSILFYIFLLILSFSEEIFLFKLSIDLLIRQKNLKI